MAVGGALRAAIRAGRFGVAARESRQQARAVRSLNESGFGQYVASRGGGISAPNRMEFAREGLPTSNSTVSRMLDGGFTPDMYGWYAEGLRGNPVFLNPNTGTRDILPPFSRFSQTQNPILAPYEGMRVLSASRPSVAQVPPAFGGPAFRAPVSGNTSTQPNYFFDDLSNPFGRNERMPQWYIDDMMQNWR